MKTTYRPQHTQTRRDKPIVGRDRRTAIVWGHSEGRRLREPKAIIVPYLGNAESTHTMPVNPPD